jgi:hypothetical protein
MLILPGLLALIWSTWPTLSAVVAVVSLRTPALYADEWSDADKVVEVKREIQKHFLNNHVYLPVEDIVTVSDSGGEKASGTLAELMKRACGKGNIYIWIPLRFRVPLVGDRIFEWCWNGNVKIR